MRPPKLTIPKIPKPKLSIKTSTTKPKPTTINVNAKRILSGVRKGIR